MKIREFSNGQEVKIVRTVWCYTKGNLEIGRRGKIIKIIDCHVSATVTWEDEMDAADYGDIEGVVFTPQSRRSSRGHTQLVKVSFGRKRKEIMSAAYLGRV